MSVIEEIQQRLQALTPIAMELIDESQHHVGHRSNGGGGHYRLTITSSLFCEKSMIMRHRLIYQALHDLIPNRIHALSIHAIAPDES
ncbi:MAG: BolA family transcriptional regulator [Betaproteobacteria bacterium]|nr:BolA family transcriptional regulator [Betaproteobacteria bacterium]